MYDLIGWLFFCLAGFSHLWAVMLPYGGFIGKCGPNGCSFSAILVIYGVSNFDYDDHFITNRAWFWHSSLDTGILFRRSYIFMRIIDKTINLKSPSQITFTAI